MSAVVCGTSNNNNKNNNNNNNNKRSFFEDLSTSSPPPSPLFKRRRFSPYPFDHIRALFPHMDNHILERVLEESDNDLDAAIKRLHELSLGYATENASAEETNGNAEKGAPATSDPTDSSAHTNPQMGSADWVELFVNEMMSASSIDDARSRATRILESLEKSISESAGAEAAQSYYKENVMLKEQIEVLLRENNILKRAVSIQHERQKEYDNKDQEVHHLKQLLAQYQEQLRTLEVNNYALTLHLQQAQQNSSIPGRFNPDVF